MLRKFILLISLSIPISAAKADFGCDVNGPGKNIVATQIQQADHSANWSSIDMNGNLKLSKIYEWSKESWSNFQKTKFGLVLVPENKSEIQVEFAGYEEIHICEFSKATLNFKSYEEYLKARSLMEAGKPVTVTGRIHPAHYISIAGMGNAYFDVEEFSEAQ